MLITLIYLIPPNKICYQFKFYKYQNSGLYSLHWPLVSKPPIPFNPDDVFFTIDSISKNSLTEAFAILHATITGSVTCISTLFGDVAKFAPALIKAS